MQICIEVLVVFFTLLLIPVPVYSRALPRSLSACNHGHCKATSSSFWAPGFKYLNLKPSHVVADTSIHALEHWDDDRLSVDRSEHWTVKTSNFRRAFIPPKSITSVGDDPAPAIAPRPVTPEDPGSASAYDPSVPAAAGASDPLYNPEAGLSPHEPADPLYDSPSPSSPAPADPKPSSSKDPTASPVGHPPVPPKAPNSPAGTSSDSSTICKRSYGNIGSRSDCTTGSSGDQGSDAGGFDSDPESETKKQPTNWFDLVNEVSSIAFEAKDLFSNKVAQNSSDVNPPSVDLHYDSEQKPVKNLFTDTADGKLLESILNNILSLKVKLNAMVSIVRSKASTGTQPVLQESIFSAEGKVIIADWNNATIDHNVDTNKLQWDEILFQEYKRYMSSGNKPLRNLAHIVRMNILNPLTVNTVKAAYNSNSIPFKKENYRSLNASAQSGSWEAKAFDAISRTPNVSGIWRLLGDFHQALGNKQIRTIHVFPDDDSSKCHLVVDVA